MRRGELLKLPELKVTETMRKTVGEDQGHQVLRCGRPPVWSATYYWFYRAKKTGTVLEIDVFTRDMILAGTAHPEYRLFLLEENKYYTYDNLCEKWRTAKIDNLSYMEGCKEIQQGYWYSSRKVWIREEDRKRISEFCHNGKEEPRAAIAFLTLYYILGMGTVITLKTGIEEDVELEGADYLLAGGFPILLFVAFLDWIVRKIVR